MATGPGLTPPQRLMALARGIGATPADGTTDLPYTYLHTQSWTRATNAITRTDLRRWRRDADGSGHEITRRLPDLPGLDHQPGRDEQTLFAQAPERPTRYLANELRPYLSDPLPSEATALAGALAPRELATEPAYPRLLANGVVGLATGQYLNREQRAASLRVLANIPGIAYLGESTDLAGRTGLIFAVTADGSTSQLLVDPRSGDILAAQERVTGHRPGLFSYVLILARGHTASSGAAAQP
ncbi:hypothetical protein [Micromonospora coxensis]|uniref:Uncharacterized protein n=1 Tax=Micromonospora coxensis TaxID=356852 RepID=A0A1C5GY72_9ACTN|nr:hypothetical protein [Micromonospora coxensis]SCG38688.1 hypothetical protein GA0070614_0548 [Micromonospora coxensis]